MHTLTSSQVLMADCMAPCRLASRAMAVTNQVSANRVLSSSDLAKQYQSELLQLRHHISRRASGEERSAAVVTLRQQVSSMPFGESGSKEFAMLI